MDKQRTRIAASATATSSGLGANRSSTLLRFAAPKAAAENAGSGCTGWLAAAWVFIQAKSESVRNHATVGSPLGSRETPLIIPRASTEAGRGRRSAVTAQRIAVFLLAQTSIRAVAGLVELSTVRCQDDFDALSALIAAGTEKDIVLPRVGDWTEKYVTRYATNDMLFCDEIGRASCRERVLVAV